MMTTGCLALSVSSTGSFSLEHCAPRSSTSQARISFSILDWIVFSGTVPRIIFHLHESRLSVSSTGSFSLERNGRPRLPDPKYAFSILDWIVFSGTQILPKIEPAIKRAFSILDWIVFSGTSRLTRPNSTAGPFSILDWIVFSGTMTELGISVFDAHFQYPRLDRFLWNSANRYRGSL